ncbi:endo alpha-1,4 polygalactosaminidase [Herbiconiux sp. CPCC 203407]|uniref:Endo alpha-1,4 polygalactosaminidase n=1 Tax=Herbiconiux oxytropis TaxID=2970915 RepID=A0AA41XIG5_9MICO|nr:endo alpha-1,4 polygalactosaminidase [Herbiconiux oxytropis]MCS5722283.1 endo alpha-1,4 polygalactosaminidase [Herbiconiux oxytropis]MCS5727079.1 endo alpha-1,4 polygalactosaminidase [Herbiconiux oxytropis]
MRAAGSFAAFAVAAAGALSLLLAGCAGPTTDPTLFPADPVVDYQLGGGYTQPEGVTVVARDSTDEPAAGVYSICYVNGFQTQPGADWPDELVLHDASGAEVFDPGWPDERLLDIRTAQNREAAAEVLAPVIGGCADAGFQAVEFDNLDSYTRSDGAFGLEEAVAFGTLLVEEAHAAGLAAGQKNTPQLADRGHDEMGFDFAVAEECAYYEECSAYTDVYGDRVIDIEYADAFEAGAEGFEGALTSFEEACADPARPFGTVLRDRDLAPAGAEGHVYARC